MIVPEDAISLDVETIDAGGDESVLLRMPECSVVMVNIPVSWFSQDRRMFPRNMLQPRAELYAALLNAHTGEVVCRSFYKWHTSSIKFCDSQIVLRWINNNEKPMKQWVRNRVIKIRRFTSPSQWFYVQSNDC